MRRRRRTATLGVLLLVLAAPTRTGAAQPATSTPAPAARAGAPRILILASSRDEHISRRLQAELRSLRFDVPDIEITPEPPSRPQLERAARERDAVAAVRIVPSSTGVEVWIVDRITGKTVLRELVTTEGDSTSHDATVALRVVELLRASLMELDAPRPPPGEVPAPRLLRELMAPPGSPEPPPPIVPVPTPPTFSLEIGPGAILSPGGFGPSGLVSAAVHYRPSATTGVSLFALVPIVPASVSGPEGDTTLRSTMLGVGLRLALRPPTSTWTPTLGVGLSALWLRLDGQPAAGFVGSSGDVISAGPHVRAGLGVTLLPRLRLRTDVLCGVALPATVVKFGGRTAAVWGVPFVAPTLGLEVLWQ